MSTRKKRIERRAKKLGWGTGKKELFIKSLGKSVDRVVADTFGVPLPFVYACRQDLGIGRFQKVAKKPKAARKKLRKKLRKKPRKQRPNKVLPDALIERLGTIPDAHLAKEFGIGARTVTRERNKRGIPSNKTSVHLDMVNLIHKMIKEGDLPDAEIARRLQVPDSVVTRQRRQLNIAAIDRRAIQCPDKIKMLGTASDAGLARLWGLTRENVRQARNREGIPAFVPEGWKRVGRHKKNRGGES